MTSQQFVLATSCGLRSLRSHGKQDNTLLKVCVQKEWGFHCLVSSAVKCSLGQMVNMHTLKLAGCLLQCPVSLFQWKGKHKASWMQQSLHRNTLSATMTHSGSLELQQNTCGKEGHLRKNCTKDNCNSSKLKGMGNNIQNRTEQRTMAKTNGMDFKQNSFCLHAW